MIQKNMRWEKKLNVNTFAFPRINICVPLKKICTCSQNVYVPPRNVQSFFRGKQKFCERTQRFSGECKILQYIFSSHLIFFPPRHFRVSIVRGQHRYHKLVSSQERSFIFFNIFLTILSRSFRALCSSSKDFFIFL